MTTKDEALLMDMFDDDDITVTSGTRPERNEQAEVEILVRFQVPNSPNALRAKHLMSGVLTTILQAFQNNVVYIDNKQEEFVYNSRMSEDEVANQLKNASMTAHEVRIKHSTQTSNRWIMILKFRTTIPFRDWKKNETVLAGLRKNRIFMTPHKFEQHEWDIISLGFLLGIHVVQFPQEAAKEYLESLIKHDEPTPPHFSLHPAKVQMKGKSIYTRAYEVTCLRDNGQRLYNLMTHGQFRDPKHRIFVPYSLKRTNPTTFQTLLKENNQMLGDSYVMKIQGIPRAGIQQIEKKIRELTGVRFVVPTSKTTSHGEWRILIKSSKFQGVNGHIRQHWDSWSRALPRERYNEVPDSFPIPSITSKNFREIGKSDDLSEESYGTLLSTASTLTVETLDGTDDYNYCPLDGTLPTYAQVLHNNQLQSPASTITPSIHRTQAGSTTTPGQNGSNSNRWEEENKQLQQTINDQEARIRALDLANRDMDSRLEKILEEVQNKECRTKELEETIAKLLTIVHDRDQQMAERDQQFELRNRQFDMLMSRLEHQHSTCQPNQRTQDYPSGAGNNAIEAVARSNKRHHTLQTTNNEQTLVTEYYDADMHDITDEIRPAQKC